MHLTEADIARNNTVKSCPLCKGKGTFIEPSATAIPTKNPNRVVHFSQARLCICRKNELVETSSPYFANTRAIKSVAENVAAGMAKTHPYTRNTWFEGDYTTFMQRVKCVFVHHRQNCSLIFQVISGLEAIQNYYVEQKDGAERTLYDLVNNRDLLVILCTTQVQNKALSNTVLQIVQDRVRLGKGTWVWTPKDFASMTEYSEELQKILSGWSAINVDKGF